MAGNTLVSASSLEKEIEGTAATRPPPVVGKVIAERGKDKGIDTVVFDRGGYLYHGRVAELAEGAREAAWNSKGRRKRQWQDLKENPASISKK